MPPSQADLAWMWWIPMLPLLGSVLCGLLHFLTLRARGAWAPKAGGQGHGHGDEHGHDAAKVHTHDDAGHDDAGHDCAGHDCAGHDCAARDSAARDSAARDRWLSNSGEHRCADGNRAHRIWFAHNQYRRHGH